MTTILMPFQNATIDTPKLMQLIMCTPNRTSMLSHRRVAWDIELAMGAMVLVLLGIAALVGASILLMEVLL